MTGTTTFTALVITLPLRLSNPLNGSHGHWAIRSRERAAIRTAVALAMRARLPHPEPTSALPLTILVTRIAPRKLDAWDGLGASAKPAIDGIADAFGVRDDDPRITWRVGQRRGDPREYAVEITVSR